MDIMEWIYVIVLIVYFLGEIFFWAVFFMYRIKCVYVKKCSDRQCRFRKFCNKYHKTLTQKEMESLIRMLDSLD